MQKTFARLERFMPFSHIAPEISAKTNKSCKPLAKTVNDRKSKTVMMFSTRKAPLPRPNKHPIEGDNIMTRRFTAALAFAVAAFIAAGTAGAVTPADIPADSQFVTSLDRQQAVKGSPKFFTGDVTVQSVFPAMPGMAASGGVVVFEAGSRSFWHTHPVGQVLYILEGEGRSGVYGEKVSTLKAGDIVICPKGVKHFHGASPAKRMVQMTVTGETPDGKNVEWLEEVTDEQYMNTAK